MISTRKMSCVWITMALCLGAAVPIMPIVFGVQEFTEKEVAFENETAGISLSGTLTEPIGKGPFPALLLISGDGPNDREYGRMFSAIAHRLGRMGVASLRYDSRGVGKSRGVFKNATIMDLSDDANSAIAHLKTLGAFSSIGVLGHSQGGSIASILAARGDDISLVILLSTPGRPISQLDETWHRTQDEEQGEKRETTERFLRIRSKLYDLIRSGKMDAETKMLVTMIVSKTMKVADVDEEVARLFSPTYRCRLDFDPTEYLRGVHCPVLVMGGSLDTWVLPKYEFPAIEKALGSGGNTDVTFEELPGLNHSLQKCKTGSVEEAKVLDESINDTALDLIERWIFARVTKGNR